METEVKAKGRKRESSNSLADVIARQASMKEQLERRRQQERERERRLMEEMQAALNKARESFARDLGYVALEELGENITLDDFRKLLKGKGNPKPSAPKASEQVEAQGGGSPSAPGGSL